MYSDEYDLEEMPICHFRLRTPQSLEQVKEEKMKLTLAMNKIKIKSSFYEATVSENSLIRKSTRIRVEKLLKLQAKMEKDFHFDFFVDWYRSEDELSESLLCAKRCAYARMLIHILQESILTMVTFEEMYENIYKFKSKEDNVDFLIGYL